MCIGTRCIRYNHKPISCTVCKVFIAYQRIAYSGIVFYLQQFLVFIAYSGIVFYLQQFLNECTPFVWIVAIIKEKRRNRMSRKRWLRNRCAVLRFYTNIFTMITLPILVFVEKICRTNRVEVKCYVCMHKRVKLGLKLDLLYVQFGSVRNGTLLLINNTDISLSN